MFSSVKQFLKPIVLGALMAASINSVPSAQAMEAEQKQEIEQIVREYLLNNPELIVEVQQALEIKQKALAAERTKLALAVNKEIIFNSPHQGTIGNTNGDITIVEFFDYNCGFCQRAMKDMNVLLEGDNKLKFVMKELPILSQGSVDASRVSTAVYRLMPEKYGEFHNRLLSQEGQKDGNRARNIASEMGLDVKAIEAEVAKDDMGDAFREASDLANKLGINGTPSYVIGDEVVFGALGVEVLSGKIANVRKCGRTVCS